MCARFLLSLPARGDFFPWEPDGSHLDKVSPLAVEFHFSTAQRHSGIFPLRIQLCDSINKTWLPGFKSVLKDGFTPSAHRDAAVTLDVNKIAQQWWENPTFSPLLNL